ncbi:hypothetical protein CMUS01_01291 [Colletotrichum musicola]|uniref:Uncharacterized protein n=1 Tax=Colletotrichum musicola TaxID=2175873 RepID=A0A8H6U8P0_9PEZI|nr:hypothetical protein CMUS01_01291 [Colletotrichum musicola]
MSSTGGSEAMANQHNESTRQHWKASITALETFLALLGMSPMVRILWAHHRSDRRNSYVSSHTPPKRNLAQNFSYHSEIFMFYVHGILLVQHRTDTKTTMEIISNVAKS